jgi:hypothetical protein
MGGTIVPWLDVGNWPRTPADICRLRLDRTSSELGARRLHARIEGVRCVCCAVQRRSHQGAHVVLDLPWSRTDTPAETELLALPLLRWALP